MSRMLGTPCKIGSVTVRNRIIMEAMGNALSELDGKVSKADIEFYGARAKGGCGLIMSEAISVDSVTGRANERNMCIDDDSQIPGYKQLADEVHKYGSLFFVELYHPGRQGTSAVNGGRKMFAPSAIECKLVHQPVQAMTLDDIIYIKKKFVDGAIRCQKAGIDGVMLHAAHGYLLTQFLSPYTNKREDEYGGSLENRARLVVEIIKEIREAVGPDYPIAVRFSAHEYLSYNGQKDEEGITLDISTEYAKMFEKAGADLLDVSSGNYETMNTAWEPTGFDQGWKSNLAREIKKHVSVPVVCTALIRDPEYAEQLLAEGACDFIGSARCHLADPEWGNKAMAGEDNQIRKCICCLTCMKGLMAGEMHCAVNAQACFETTRSELKEDGDGRLCVVIGGGPAGMEAARVLALRKFKVVLYEKDAELGGALLQAERPPHKEKIGWFIKYLSDRLEELGVEVHCNTTADVEMIKALDPYAVFAAAGADPLVPRSIPGIFGDNVVIGRDLLTGEAHLDGKKKIVQVGAGFTGLETAEWLAEQGHTVSIYDMLPEVARGEHFQNIIDVEHRIGNIPQNTGHKLLEITPDSCVFENEKGEKVVDKCDNVVLCMGMRPKKDFADQLAAEFKNFYVLGTNLAYSGIGPAVESAYVAAMNL